MIFMNRYRWIAGISLLERRESEDISRMCGVRNIREKAREPRLRYFGHMKRRDEKKPVKKAVTGRRNARRQIIRWKDLVKQMENGNSSGRPYNTVGGRSCGEEERS